MEHSESAINRVGRTMWTVWGYLTGTVGRYLRPEVTNKEAQTVQHIVPISKDYKELNIKEEEKTETKPSERKTREDLQYPRIRVHTAAVQWEKGNIAYDHHKVKDKSKQTCASSESIDKKPQAKNDDEEMLDNKSESRRTHGTQFTEQEDSPAYVDTDVKNRERTFSGSEEADLNVERSETNQEKTKQPLEEEEENIMRRQFDETEEEPVKCEFIDQGLLTKEDYLNVERRANSQEERRKSKEEEEGVDILKRENDEPEEEPFKNDSIDQGLLTKEFDLNVERSENIQEQRRQQEEEGVDEIMMSENDETGEELTKSKFTERGLVAREADLNVERNENDQEQVRKSEEEQEGVDEVVRRKDDETKEEPIKSELIEEGLLAKEAGLNVERRANTQEERRKQEEEEGVNEISRKEYDEIEESTKSEFIEEGLLAKEVDLNVEMDEDSQELRRESKEEEEGVDDIRRRENDESDEPIKTESIDQGLLTKEFNLNVERNENSQEQRRKSDEEEEGVDKISKRKYDETEEPIKSELMEEGLLAKEADLNLEKDENIQEQRRKQEEEGVDEIMSENDETGEELTKSKFTEQGLVAREADLNVERNENDQEQVRKSEEEQEGVEVVRRKDDETKEDPIKSELTEEGLLAKEAGLNVERRANTQEERRKPDHEEEEEEEEESVNEMSRKEYDEIEESTKSEFIEEGLLAKEVDLNVEMDEDRQELRRESKEEEEGVDEIRRRENDESDEPIKSESIDQGLLTKEFNLNVERSENSQEQRRKSNEEEGVDKISKRKYDETEEPIKSEFMEEGLLAKEADLNIERDENIQEQRRKQEGEGIQIVKRKIDEIEKELIKSEFIEEGLLDKETDLKAEMDENSQQLKRKSKEEGIDKIRRRENDESDEEPIKSELIDQGLLTKEADLNGERQENSQEQRRKQEEDDVEKIIRGENNETEKEPITCELIEDDVLAKEPDLNVERNENSQEKRRKSEEKEEDEEGVNEISRREYHETEEEPIKDKFIDQDPKEQANTDMCDMGDTAVVQVVSVEKIMECIYDQDIHEPNVVEQSNQERTEHENEGRKSQIVDEVLLMEPASTWEGRDPLKDSLKLEVEMTKNATLLQGKEVTEVNNEETKIGGKLKDGYHEEFSARKQFTGTDIVEEQKVCDTGMKETLKKNEDIDKNVETECELQEMEQIENAEMDKNESEPSRMFEDEGNNLTVTMELQQLEQSKEEKATSEVALNVDLGQLDDKAHDHNSSQQQVMVTKQEVEGVITRPETSTGNQLETVETTSKFRAEVAAVDVKKSAERETSSHKQPIDREEVAGQEIMGQCFLEQGFLLEESANPQINELSFLEAPFSEIKSVPLEQGDETAVESVDEMQSKEEKATSEVALNVDLRQLDDKAHDHNSSQQELDECSSEAELNVAAKSSSPSKVTGMSKGELKCEQAQPECEISLVENTCDQSILNEIPLEKQINQSEYTAQDSTAEASSHRLQIGLSQTLYLPDRQSEQETLEIQRDSQKDTEEQQRTDEAETGLLNEIKDATSSSGILEDIMSGLTKESEDSERELLREMEDHERKEQKSELESHEETSEGNMNVELLNDTWECKKESVAEMTGIETMVVSTGGEMESVKKMEELITEDEKAKCHLVFSELEASEEELLLPLQTSSLDFTVQKSKIAVKNPRVRPPKDHRTHINMASLEPLTSPHPSQSHIEGASGPSKGVIGFKLPGLGAGFPALRKTEAGRKIRDAEDSESVTPQKSDSGSQSADDNVKQETSPHKPRWTPPRQPGMGSPLMMAELKSKLKKPVKE